MGGSAVSGSFGAKQDSPVKPSGFGTGAAAAGMQKLNLGNVGNQRAQQDLHDHGHSYAPPKQSVYNQQDLEDLEDFDDF